MDNKNNNQSNDKNESNGTVRLVFVHDDGTRWMLTKDGMHMIKITNNK